MRIAAPVAIVLLLTTHAAQAEPVISIRDNGRSVNRINVIVLGDGYTADELLKYARDVDILVNSIFLQQPFASYTSYFNVYRVDVISNESGADHPERGVMRDTALGARYNCNDTQRLICVDSAAIRQVLDRSSGLPANRDMLIVVVNDPEYGGSGYATVSTHSAAVEIVLHEIGHSLGLLGDEYSTGETCENPVEPRQVNVTRQTAREQIKWTHWIALETDVPTLTRAPQTPGLYPGAFCADGLYRPTFDSKMRSLGRPYEQINTEQLIKRFYNFVSPIDGVFPTTRELTVRIGEPMGFVIDRMRPADHELSVEWTVDDVAVGNGDELRLLDTSMFEPGKHSIQVVVRDTTPSVLKDPTNALTARFAWLVTIVR